jgi:hypothetical protein
LREYIESCACERSIFGKKIILIISGTIRNYQSFEVVSGHSLCEISFLIVIMDLICQKRGVNPSIAVPADVQWVLEILWETLEEVLDEGEKVDRHRVVIVV